MRPDEHKAAMRRMGDVLEGMDLPPHRRSPRNNDCLRWLARCLHQRNSGHPRFQEAVDVLRSLGHEASLPDRS